MAPTRKLAELFYELRARSTGLEKDLQAAETQFGKLSAFVKANPTAAITALGTAVAGVALKAARMASEVETSLRRVGNAVPNGIKGLDTLRAGIESVSRDTGIAQAELARNLQEIARAGVEGPEQAVLRLKAVQTAVDATGESFSSVVEGLDQTLDLFGGSSEDAARALGTLFAAAKGRSSLTDLFAQLQAAAPAVNQLKLDLDTTARALVALGEKGLSAKQAASELNRLAESGAAGREAIVKLASSIQPTVDGLADLQQAADDFNNSAEQLNKRALNDLQSTLIDLGRSILPTVADEFRDLLDIIELFTGARAKRIKELGLSELGAKFADVTRKNADVLELQSRGFVAAAKELSEILAQGQLDVIATTVDGANAVARGIQRLADVGILKAEEAKKLLTDLRALSKQAGPQTPLVGGGGATGPTAEELKRQQQAAKEAREEIEQLGKELGRLGTVQQFATGEAKLSASAYADFAAELIVARQKFPQFAEDIDAMSKRLFQLRQAASSFEGAELAREMQALLASFTTTTVDDLELSLAALQKRFRERGATDEQIAQITALEEAFIKVRGASEDLDEALAQGRRGGITPLKEMVGLLAKLEQAERDLQVLESAGPQHDRERKELLEQIEKLKQRIKELEDDTAEATKKTTDNTANLTRGLSKALDVAFGIATALAGADDTLTKMIGSAASVARGLDDIASLAREAGGLGKLFSSGAGILSALPGIGQIIGGGAAIASLLGEDPERARATRELREAADALKRAAGDLARISIAGATVASVQRAVSGITVPNLGSGRATDDAVSGALLAQALRAAGIAMKDFQQIAKDLGFDFSKGVTAEGLKLFKERLADLDFKAFTDTFAGALDALEQRFKLFEVDTPAAQFDALITLLTDPKLGAPALFGALDGLDTKTEEGRQKAKEAIQKIFQGIVDGTITPDALGGLNLDQLREILDRLFGLVGDTVDEITSLLDRLNQAFSDIDLDLAIAGDTNPITKAIRRAAAAIANDPRIASALAGLDLANEEGRRAAIAALQKLAAGADKELKQIILELLDSIRAVPGTVQDGPSGESVIVSNAARGLTETTGNRMADYLATANILNREEIALLTEIRDRIAPIMDVAVPSALIRPPSFSGALGAGAVASSNVTLVIQDGAFVVNTPATVTDQQSLQDFLSGPLPTAFVRKVSEGLATDTRNILRARGISNS